MLKRSLFYCLLALSGLASAAATEQQVLFEPKAMFPAQGGPGGKMLFLPQGTALLMGGVGTLLVGHNTGLGAGGYSLSGPYVLDDGGIKKDLGLSFGGLILDYSLLPKRLFYLNASVMSGLGQAYITPRQVGADRIISNFFFVDPQFNVMMNVTRELRVAFGVGYLATGGADILGTVGIDVRGANAQVVLHYGKL